MLMSNAPIRFWLCFLDRVFSSPVISLTMVEFEKDLGTVIPVEILGNQDSQTVTFLANYFPAPQTPPVRALQLVSPLAALRRVLILSEPPQAGPGLGISARLAFRLDA
eukprot:GABV01011671.1.p1 GENE.GABV01011671.1~~GABV01011671.1.p1  ORF type:complete len:108 (-),score=3.77 GABV01011671.1:3-326(-)